MALERAEPPRAPDVRRAFALASTMEAAMQDEGTDDAIRRRAYAIWEEEGRPDGRDREHWARASAEAGRPGEEGAPSYGEAEQPGEGHPPPGSGLEEATDQAGAGTPGPTSDSPEQRVQTEDEPGETEARLQDDNGAGRPGKGIYAGP
jgi:hypothetical protein